MALLAFAEEDLTRTELTLAQTHQIEARACYGIRAYLDITLENANRRCGAQPKVCIGHSDRPRHMQRGLFIYLELSIHLLDRLLTV